MDYKRILKLRYEKGFSCRGIAGSTGYGKSAIGEFIKRFDECEALSWPLPEEVTNEYIESLLYKRQGNVNNDAFYRDFSEEEVHRKLSKKGETLLHLWKLYNAEGEVDGKGGASFAGAFAKETDCNSSRNIARITCLIS